VIGLVVMRYEVSGMTSNDGLVGLVEDGDRANGDEIYEVAGMSSSDIRLTSSFPLTLFLVLLLPRWITPP
jgi:hypothetical protein